MALHLKKITLIMLGISLSAGAIAAESMVKVTEGKDYNLDADLSYLLNTTQSSGTASDTKQSFSGNIDYKRTMGDWGGEFKASAVNSSDSNSAGSNIEQYLAFGKMTHNEGSFYEFGKLQWEKDLTSAFDYQTSLTAGLGKELYRDDVQFLTSEVGAGVRYDVDRLPPQDSQTEVIGTVAAHYERQLLPTTKFIQDLGFDYGSKSNTIRSHSALSVMMTDKLSGLVSFDYKKINADIGSSRTTLTAVGLKYSY
jgi:putative salt-induced outer membrane protein